MVTDEMVEKAANAIAEKRGYVWPGAFDAEEIKIGRENMRAALEAALSAAEPDELYNADALMNDGGDNRQTAAEEVLTYLLIEVVGAPDDVPYSANRAGALIEERLKQQPAPPLAVKALEWKQTVDYYRGSERREQWMAETPWGSFTIWHYRLPEDELKHGPKFRVGAHLTPYTPHDFDYPSLAAAQEAAQKDYEARIRLALSAQVQDVAGWQLVPKEPTDEMLDAYWAQTGESELMRSRVHSRAKIHYEAMLATAPVKQEGGE
ncbi:hypothetical protein G6M16_008930 [Agrobacterium tumefaciens]|nr:hypothetical protein G6M16_008930 [Agrobacterium tumefaciens]